MAPRIGKHILYPVVYRIKGAHSFGATESRLSGKLSLLTRLVFLVKRNSNISIMSLQCDQPELLSMVYPAKVSNFDWPGNHGLFLKHCADLIFDLPQKRRNV